MYGALLELLAKAAAPAPAQTDGGEVDVLAVGQAVLADSFAHSVDLLSEVCVCV